MYFWANQQAWITSNFLNSLADTIERERHKALRIYKQNHPKVRIERHRIRTIYTAYGTLKCTVTYLSKPHPTIPNKRVSFVFYQHPFLAENARKQYDINYINDVIKGYLLNQKTQAINHHKYPSNQLIRHYINSSKHPINQSIYSTNQALLNEKKEQFKALKDKEFCLEVDDAFMLLNHQNKRQKYAFRMLMLHPKQPQNTPINYNDSVGFYLLKPSKNYKKDSTAELANQLKNYLNQYNIAPEKLTINGDGAPWIQKLSSALNCTFLLDKFHLKAAILRAYTITKKSNKTITDYLQASLPKYGNYSTWKHILLAICNQPDYAIFTEFADCFKRSLVSLNIQATHQKAISALLSYLMKNRSGIWFKNPNKAPNSSHTEHFVFKTIKRFNPTKLATYSPQTIKLFMLTNNIQNKISTIFLNP